MHFAYRPKDNYLISASIKDLDKLAALWKSRISFKQEELLFLKNLIENEIAKPGGSKHYERLSEICPVVERKMSEVKTLLGRIDMHSVHIEELLEGIFQSDENIFRKSNSDLEDKVSRFIVKCDELKREIFSIYSLSK